MHILLVADADSRYGASHSMHRMTSKLLKFGKGLRVTADLLRPQEVADGRLQGTEMRGVLRRVLAFPAHEDIP